MARYTRYKLLRSYNRQQLSHAVTLLELDGWTQAGEISCLPDRNVWIVMMSREN